MNRKSKASSKSKVSNKPNAAAFYAKLDAIERELLEYLPQFPVPHLDVYNVNFCPHCGESFTTVREAVQRHFAGSGKTVTLPPDVCLNCGLDYCRVTIAPEPDPSAAQKAKPSRNGRKRRTRR